MIQIKQSNTEEVTRPEATNMIDQIKQLLRTTGTNVISVEKVEQPARAHWLDNKGDPHESVVLAVGMDGDGDLFLTLEDGCGGEVQIWESYGQISDNDLETVLENIKEYMAEGICDNPDRLVIADDVDEVVEVFTTTKVNPDLFRCRVKCLMLPDLSQAEAEEFDASTSLQPEAIPLAELARRIYNLPFGRILHFKLHKHRDLYGVTRLNMFECDTLLVSYYGGGNTSVFDATWDYSASDIASWIRDVIDVGDNTMIYQINKKTCDYKYVAQGKKFLTKQ